ncbi:MAG: hypothetical protein RIS43_232 [Actinomycetota bacterium]
MTNVQIPRGSLRRGVLLLCFMMAKTPLTPIPAVVNTGIREGKIGTISWAVVAVFAFIFNDFCEEIGLYELRQISVAGVILGLIGLAHVTRRAKKLNLLP